MTHRDTWNLLILGAGGHGRVVADVVRACGHVVAGYVDRDASKLHSVVEPGGAKVEVLQKDLDPDALPHAVDALVHGVGANAARASLDELFYEWIAPALVHPSAIVSPSAAVGAGTVVMPRAVLHPSARVGRSVIVNTGAIIEHDCEVGDHAHLSPGAVLCGVVTVGPRAWVGAGAVVLPGVVLGQDVVVGAGAVVLRDVPAGATVVGNPARALKQQDP
ncbi:MAG: acetyltransferase [Myxococcota bacterium]